MLAWGGIVWGRREVFLKELINLVLCGVNAGLAAERGMAKPMVYGKILREWRLAGALAARGGGVPSRGAGGGKGKEGEARDGHDELVI